MFRIGTAHFLSFASAVRYYRDYEGDNACIAVVQMIRDGEIQLGKPTLKTGERAVLIDNGTRYAIETEKL